MDMGLGKSYYSSEFPIELGKLNSNWRECKQLADKFHIPAIFYWTPGSGCSKCSLFEREVFANANFINWYKNTPYIYSYTEGDDGASKSE